MTTRENLSDPYWQEITQLHYSELMILVLIYMCLFYKGFETLASLVNFRIWFNIRISMVQKQSQNPTAPAVFPRHLWIRKQTFSISHSPLLLRIDTNTVLSA